MADWIREYRESSDLDERYRLLREEMARLRGTAHESENELFDPDEVAATVRDLNDRVDGALLVFVASDFGLPVAYRPAERGRSEQNEVREAILSGKYETDDRLNAIRRDLLAAHPSVHKAIVAEYGEAGIRYHLPEGSSETTNFLTVREMVGLVDYTTNSAQSESQSVTY